MSSDKPILKLYNPDKLPVQASPRSLAQSSTPLTPAQETWASEVSAPYEGDELARFLAKVGNPNIDQTALEFFSTGSSEDRKKELDLLINGDSELEKLVLAAKGDDRSFAERLELNRKIISQMDTGLLQTAMKKGKKALAKFAAVTGISIGTLTTFLANHYNTEALNQDLALVKKIKQVELSDQEASSLRFKTEFDIELHRDKIDPFLCVLLGLGIASIGVVVQEGVGTSIQREETA